MNYYQSNLVYHPDWILNPAVIQSPQVINDYQQEHNVRVSERIGKILHNDSVENLLFNTTPIIENVEITEVPRRFREW